MAGLPPEVTKTQAFYAMAFRASRISCDIEKYRFDQAFLYPILRAVPGRMVLGLRQAIQPTPALRIGRASRTRASGRDAMRDGRQATRRPAPTRIRTLDLLRGMQTPKVRDINPANRFILGTSARNRREVRPWFKTRVPGETRKGAAAQIHESIDLQGKKAAEGIRTLDLLHGKQTL